MIIVDVLMMLLIPLVVLSPWWVNMVCDYFNWPNVSADKGGDFSGFGGGGYPF